MSPEEVLQSYAGQDVAPTRMSADDVLDTAKARIRRGRTRVAVAAGVAVALVLAGVAFGLPDRGPKRGQPAVPPSGRPSASATAREWPPSFTRPGPTLSCTVRALPEPPGLAPDSRAVTTIDPTGAWIVGMSKHGLLIWHGGKVTNPPAARYFNPIGVDAQGTVAGYEVLANDGKAAAVFRDGKVTRLPVPEFTVGSEVTGLDAHGNLIGTVELDEHGGSQPVLWPAAGGVVRITTPPELAMEDHAPPGPDGISADGVMLGHVYLPKDPDGGRRQVAYRWNLDGTGALIQSPTTGPVHVAGDWVVGPGRVGADLEAIRGRTFAPGEIPEDEPYLRWNLRTGTADAMGSFRPFALSASGRAFGARNGHDFRPELWSDGTVTSLPLLHQDRSEPRQGGISADGRTIVATLRAEHAAEWDIVVWTC